MLGTSMSGSAQALRASAGCAAIALLAWGCASAPRASEPARTPAQVAGVDAGGQGTMPEALPALPVAQVTTGGQSQPRIQRFDAVDQDLRTALRGLAQSFGLGVEIDPDVHGLVNTRLENVTLNEALGSLLARHSYAYQIQGGVLRVTGSRMQSKTFSLDYVSLSRFGSTSTQLTTGIGSGVQLGQQQLGGTGAGAGGSVSIQSTTAANLWQDIRIALEALVFYDDAPDTTTRQITSAATSETAVPVGGQLAAAVPTNVANSVLGAARSRRRCSGRCSSRRRSSAFP
jgi:hypothetical protein